MGRATGLFLGLASLLFCAQSLPTAQAQDSLLMQPEEVYVNEAVDLPSGISGTIGGEKSNAYPHGEYYDHLHSAGGQGGGCGADGSCGPTWGVGGSPHRTGPGCGDNYRVGPRWRVVADGLLMHREETDLAALAAAVGTTLGAADQFENFDYGGGVRILGTAYWPQYKGYELVVGYLGVEEWNANVVLPVVSLPPVVGPPASVGVDERRTLNYQSSLHTLELNWQAVNNSAWKPYGGVRYFLLDEDVEDRTRQFATVPLAVGESAIATSLFSGTDVENNLIGFQLGVRRDLWKLSKKVYVQGFANAGIYGNFINRTDTTASTTTTTEVLDDDPATVDVDETGTLRTVTQRTGNRVKTERVELAFASEASLTLVWKINQCCALRSGYEVLILNGVELGDDAFLGNVQDRDLVFHGFFAGVEYRR